MSFICSKHHCLVFLPPQSFFLLHFFNLSCLSKFFLNLNSVLKDGSVSPFYDKCDLFIAFYRSILIIYFKSSCQMHVVQNLVRVPLRCRPCMVTPLLLCVYFFHMIPYVIHVKCIHFHTSCNKCQIHAWTPRLVSTSYIVISCNMCRLLHMRPFVAHVISFTCHLM